MPLLTHEATWGKLKALVDHLASHRETTAFLDVCVDTVAELMGASHGLITLRTDDARVVMSARSGGRPLDASEASSVAMSIIDEAFASGQCTVWEPTGGAASSESFHELGLVAALAAPLTSYRAGLDGRPTRRVRGVLYVDFRATVKVIDPLEREFVEVAAIIIATAIEQRERLARTEAALADAETEGVRIMSLEDLLRPDGMAAVRRDVLASVHGDDPILITGESGTGKTALARALANASGRTPVVRAVLGSSDDLNTITSELFGHERGSFSGAVSKRIGLVEQAAGGVIILDEILNLPAPAQQLLLDFVQFGTYRPLGWSRREPKRAKVRIIAATNGDLEAAMAAGRFRQDLYYRLAGSTIELPALRARRQDIPELCAQLLSESTDGAPWRLTVDLRRALSAPAQQWKGNIRQLALATRQARRRAEIDAPGARTIDVSHFTLEGGVGTRRPSPLLSESPPADLAGHYRAIQAARQELEARERTLMKRALSDHKGNVAATARTLGMARTTLASRLDALGLRGRR